MKDLSKEILKTFGDRLRVRVCGICIQNGSILLIKHQGVGEKGIFWAPPGGGMNFGESVEECLIREIKEETGLDIAIRKFLFVHEFLSPPLHAIELFFEVDPLIKSMLTTGKDPEMNPDKQIIQEVKFMPFSEISRGEKSLFHNIFSMAGNPEDLLQMTGYFKYENSNKK